MGCTSIKKKPDMIIFTKVQCNYSYPSMAGGNFLSIATITNPVSRENTSSYPKCLKLQILPKCPKVARKKLILVKTQLWKQAPQYIMYYDLIGNMYTQYTSFQRNFCKLVHESCFRNFIMSDGITIMMISVSANRQAQINYCKDPPYFSLTGKVNEKTTEILKSWEEFIKIIEVIAKEKRQEIEYAVGKLQEFYKTMEEYAEFALKPGRLYNPMNNTISAIETAGEILKEATVFRNSIQKYFNSNQNQRKIIDQLGEKASSMSIYAGEHIVHYLFNDYLIKKSNTLL